MYKRSWKKLVKTNDGYKYEPATSDGHRVARLNFTQLAFDHDEECLIVTDTQDHLHYVELSLENIPCCKRLGKVGRATCLAFNPLCKGEALIGLDSGDVRIWKLRTEIDESFLLSGHQLPPMYLSFYDNYCATCSMNEVVIWCLRSYTKVCQLKVNGKDTAIKKAAFSSAGHIIVFYCNDTMQAWTFGRLDEDVKINARLLGVRHIRDFAFTRDGRAVIIAGVTGISVLSTHNWNLLKKLHLPKYLETRQLSVIPQLLDGGANKIIALLSSRCIFHFYDVDASILLETPNVISKVKKFAVSSTGRYIAYIDQEGCLFVTHAESMFFASVLQPRKLLESRKLRAHSLSDHLECIRRSLRRELDVERLVPILKEFGEYPEKHRATIWSTLLKLPINKSAYLALVSEVTREGLTSTLKKHPLADRSKASLLATTLDCLLQWCPLLAQSPFLPNLVFPFLVVFQKDPLLAFELILSILLNYCQNWFEYHPLPPLNILGIIENVLLEADAALLNIFCEHGVTTGEYAWPLLQTAMSEVLSVYEWLILWDHLITFGKPSLLLMCVVAYNIYSRENIITLVKSSGDIKAFYGSQGHVRAKDLLRIARKLDQEMPQRIHPNRYLRNDLLQLNRTGPYSLFILKEYPKFLTEESRHAVRCRAQERRLHEHDCKIAEYAERTRLRDEVEAFAKRIHETRLNEAKRCFREHIDNLWCQHLYKDPEDTQSRRIRAYKECESERDANIKEAKNVNCDKLWRDVTKLEYEVQSFIDSSRPCRSKIKCIH